MVSWNEVDQIDRNGIITVYEIIYQPQESYDRIERLQNTTSRSITLAGLHEYASYDIQVRAFTEVGPGTFSPTQNRRTETASKFHAITT